MRSILLGGALLVSGLAYADGGVDGGADGGPSCLEIANQWQAMVASMERTASSETSCVADRATSARLRTALVISSRRWSVLGLNSFWRRDSKSDASMVSAAAAS